MTVGPRTSICPIWLAACKFRDSACVIRIAIPSERKPRRRPPVGTAGRVHRDQRAGLRLAVHLDQAGNRKLAGASLQDSRVAVRPRRCPRTGIRGHTCHARDAAASPGTTSAHRSAACNAPTRENIYPVEVENLLREHPARMRSAVGPQRLHRRHEARMNSRCVRQAVITQGPAPSHHHVAERPRRTGKHQGV